MHQEAAGAGLDVDVAQRAQAAFSNSRILGFVLNAVKNAPNSGSSYYYGAREEDGVGNSRGKYMRRKG